MAQPLAPYRAFGHRCTYRTYVFFCQVSQGIALYPPNLPIAAEGGEWQEVPQLKLRSGGKRAVQGYR